MTDDPQLFFVHLRDEVRMRTLPGAPSAQLVAKVWLEQCPDPAVREFARVADIGDVFYNDRFVIVRLAGTTSLYRDATTIDKEGLTDGSDFTTRCAGSKAAAIRPANVTEVCPSCRRIVRRERDDEGTLRFMVHPALLPKDVS